MLYILKNPIMSYQIKNIYKEKERRYKVYIECLNRMVLKSFRSVKGYHRKKAKSLLFIYVFFNFYLKFELLKGFRKVNLNLI